MQFNKMPQQRVRECGGAGVRCTHMQRLRLRIQECMKFKKFQAHKPQWPRLTQLDIYYLALLRLPPCHMPHGMGHGACPTIQPFKCPHQGLTGMAWLM